MPTKTLNPEKEKRKVEAKKLRSWTCSNLTILVSSGIMPLSDVPNWMTCIRQCRMLEDIQAVWLATETIIKLKDPKAETACGEARYQEGLRNLIKLSMNGQSSNTGGVRAD
jgi:hypothetical protein